MNVLKPKISIIGCGSVGIRYAYALMIKGSARQIVLVDIDRKKAEGEVMDLSHGEPYVHSIDISAGDYPDISQSDLVVVTVGKKQLPGQTRMDLVKENITIYKTVIPKIMQYAPQAMLLIVSNPVDILSYAAYKISGKPAAEVIGSGTVLDTARFRFLLSNHCKIDPHNMHAYILGEHGDTEFPVWSSAMVGGTLFKDYCFSCKNRDACNHDAMLDRIFTEVRDSAYHIIERKGETSYGIGLALVRITQAIINDENAVLPVASLMNGFAGVNDVYLSLPAVVNKTGVREILPVPLNDEELKLFKKSADTLKCIIKDVGL